MTNIEKDMQLAQAVRAMSSGMTLCHFRQNAGDISWHVTNEFGVHWYGATPEEALVKALIDMRIIHE